MLAVVAAGVAGVADAATRRRAIARSGWRGSTGWRSSARTPSTPGSAVIWLVLGLVPALAAAFPSFADQLREWGDAGHPRSATWPLRAAGAARNSSSGVQVTLDYAFSTLNIALATFLVVKVRGNRTANLLAIGMVGTAVAFNLQSHAALVVIGTQLGGFTQLWHDLGVHVLAGIAYVFALLLFPDGSIDRSRGPHLMGLAVFFGLFSFVAIADHTSALVLLFGVLVPAAALLAHSRRFREAQSPELRQLYRLLGVAMGVSLVGRRRRAHGHVDAQVERRAVHRDDPRLRGRRRSAAGTYIFYCDPHTDGHVGHGHRRRSRRRQTRARGSCRSRPTGAGSTRTSSSSWRGRPA